MAGTIESTHIEVNPSRRYALFAFVKGDAGHYARLGVRCYDSTKTAITGGDRWFVLDGTETLPTTFTRVVGVIQGEGAGTNQFATGTKFVTVVYEGGLTGSTAGTNSWVDEIVFTDSVFTELVEDGAITTPKIPDANITGSKIANGVILDQHIGSTADIAKSKISTTGQWPETDIPVLTDAKYPNALLMDGSRVANLLEIKDTDATPVGNRRLRVIDGIVQAVDTLNTEGRHISRASVGVSDLDNDVTDGATYGRVKLTALTLGEVDLAKAGVINKTLGYITDGSLRKAVTVDLEANRPVAGTAGRLFLAKDTKRIFHDTGTAWDQIAANALGDLSGSLDNIADGATYRRVAGVDINNQITDSSVAPNANIDGSKLLAASVRADRLNVGRKRGLVGNGSFEVGNPDEWTLSGTAIVETMAGNVASGSRSIKITA